MALLGVIMCVVAILAGAGCGNSSQAVASPSAGGLSGTQQALNAPSASPELKEQAAQQQQMGDAQNEALRAANERQQASSQTTSH